MLFMITHACKDPKAARERWTNTEEKWDGLELVARYHAIGNTGVVIVRANDVGAISRWSMQWDDLFDLDVCPVMEDEEASEMVAYFQ